MDQPQATLRSIPEQECRSLLRTRSVGHLGVNAGGYPEIIPVNYAMDGDTVVIRSRIGQIIASAEKAPVTFQVDSIDEAARTGWTVLVRGRAHVLTWRDTDATAERTRRLDLQPWAPGHDSVWLRIIERSIEGRRIARTGDGQWGLDEPSL